jgi:hypothetical protein
MTQAAMTGVVLGTNQAAGRTAVLACPLYVLAIFAVLC